MAQASVLGIVHSLFSVMDKYMFCCRYSVFVEARM